MKFVAFALLNAIIVNGSILKFESDDKKSPVNVPTVTLNNGVDMPVIGLGTWEYNNSVAFKSSLEALKLGYTHIDTATMYNNQEGIGKAIKVWEKVHGGNRNDIFITTKIPGGLNYSAAMTALDKTLEVLQLDYVDLMLVHFPAYWDGKGGKQARIEGWKAMEKFTKDGKARAIGVSHFCKSHMEDILKAGTIKPAVNQVEYHVGMGQVADEGNDFKGFDDEHGILFQAFSPLCGPCKTKELITGSMVTEIGKKYKKSGAQVSLKWLIQQGIPTVPKTNNPKHMVANADLFTWELSEEDMSTLSLSPHPPVTGGGDGKTSGDCKIL